MLCDTCEGVLMQQQVNRVMAAITVIYLCLAGCFWVIVEV